MNKVKKPGVKIKNELVILLVCIIAAAALQIYANVKAETGQYEFDKQITTVLVISLIIYILVLVFRLIFMVLNKLLNRNKNV